jgi:hypothetical protein
MIFTQANRIEALRTVRVGENLHVSPPGPCIVRLGRPVSSTDLPVRHFAECLFCWLTGGLTRVPKVNNEKSPR